MNRLPIERILNALQDSTGHEPVESACRFGYDDRSTRTAAVGEPARVVADS